MKLAPIVLLAVLALALTAAAPGQRTALQAAVRTRPKPMLPAQRIVLRGIDRAAARGSIDRRSAAADRATVNRAARLIRRLPSSRGSVVADSLSVAASLADRLVAGRARIVFGQLSVTSSHLAHAGAPGEHTDVTDADGVVYRYFAGRGFVFHPLGNFAALNTDLGTGRTAAAQRLAGALLERGVTLAHGAMGWEYCFDYGGGRAPWLSGMAQATAAQGFAVTAGLGGPDAPRLRAAARAAYRSIPGRLAMKLSTGPWVRLYGFNSDVVLNAQLQSALSVGRYAHDSGDTGAAAYATALRDSALAMLPRFDTGYWSYYQLPRTPSPLEYQTFVVDLLHRLAGVDPRFADASLRFAAYVTQPPAFQLADPSLGHVRFWVSKPAGVTVSSAAGATQNMQVTGGWYDVGWKLPARAGSFPVHIVARDWAGNRAAVDALPIVHVGASGRSAARAPAAVTPGQPAFAAGAGVADAGQAKLARARGFDTVRVPLEWPQGATAPDPATVAALKSIRAPGRVVLELVADPLPADDTGRAALAAYTTSLVQQAPAIRDVLLGPPPAVATAPAYVAALALLRDSLPTLGVGAELDGAAKPAATLAALGQAYGDAALPDAIATELAFRPAAKAGAAVWTLADSTKLLAGLDGAFKGTAQPGSTLPLLLDGIAQGTRIPASKAAVYDPGITGGGAESDQVAAYTRVLQTASCLPTVTGVLLGRLVDGTAAGEQTGLYYADGTPKTSAVPVGKAAARAVRGVLQVCPGLGVPALPSTLVFPGQLTQGTPPSIRLGCVRDCLYLVTLEHAGDNRPVLAARGALRGGRAATTVTLPQAPFPAGTYRIAVRLVTQTNPGRINVLLSPPLSA